MLRRLMLLGPPGVGKGTYGKMLSKDLGIPLIGTGSLVRKEIAMGTTAGNLMSAYAATGKLVPDEVILNLVGDRLRDEKDGFILDGFPRTVNQAEMLEEIIPLDRVVNLKLKQETFLVQKLLGRRLCSSPACGKSFNVADVIVESEGVDMPALLPSHGDPTKCECGECLTRRSDDNEDVIKERLRVYNEETSPLIEYYKAKGILEDFTILKGLKDYPDILKLISTPV